MDTFETNWTEHTTTHTKCKAFVVTCRNSVAARSSPDRDESLKTATILKPGQCVLVDEMKEKDGVRFLHLKYKSGWVFDSIDNNPVMAEMKNVQIGKWWYRVVCQEFVEVRRTPSIATESRNGWVLCPKELVVVRLRCRINGLQFMLLADGRGWMFELKPGSSKNNKDFENVVLHECEDDFIVGSESAILKRLVPPTNEVVEIGEWTYIVNDQPVLALGARRNGTYLAPGDVIKIDKRAIANGNPGALEGETKTMQNRRWLRLADKRGWVPDSNPVTGKVLMVEQTDNDVAYPSRWQGNKKNADRPKEEWMSGIV